MKESDLKYKVQQTIVDFDNIGSIQPSEEWSMNLIDRLEHTSQSSGVDSYRTRIIFAVLLLILVNLGFIMNSVIRNSFQSKIHDSDLQIISKQLLVNPSSLNN